MIKSVLPRVWAFDAEWVPDPLAGRLLYDIPETVTQDEEILRVMWREGGATEEDPTPFLKTVMCRVVSIVVVERWRENGKTGLEIKSLPRDVDDPNQVREAHVIGTFLDALGRRKPQLVGFNSIDSDLKILVQRGFVLGIRAADFCRRPAKPWEGIDYFARFSEHNVDLKDILGGWGSKLVPSLHELAVQAGIPGKMEVDGNQVARLWLDGNLRKIVQYNEYDAVTTYLVWLRLAHLAGHFSSTEYGEEQQAVRRMLEQQAGTPERAHLAAYLEEWDRLARLTRTRGA